MAGYRRFVAYVYEYPDGKKGNGKGFIKVEARDGKCRMNYRVQGIYGKEKVPCNIYGFVRNGDGCEGIYLGECDLAGDMVQFQTEVPDQGLGGTVYGLNDLSGLVMLTGDGTMYGTGWDDRPVRLEEIRFPRMQEEKPQNTDRAPERRNKVSKEALEKESGTAQDELAEGVAAVEALIEAETNDQSELTVEAEAHLTDANRAETGDGMEENRAETENAMEADWEAGNNAMRGNRTVRGGFMEEPEPGPEEQPEQRMEPAMPSQSETTVQPAPSVQPVVETPRRSAEQNRNTAAPSAEENRNTTAPPAEENRNTAAPPAEENRNTTAPSPEENPDTTVPDTDQLPYTEEELYRETIHHEIFGEDQYPNSEMRIEASGSADEAERSTWNQKGDCEEDEVNLLEELDQDEDAIRNMRRMEKEVTEKKVQKPKEGAIHTQSAQAARQPAVFAPFSDGEIVDCRQITPAELGILARRDRGLMHNNFLRHGYYRYHYLLLGKRRDDGRYILGVPGVYDRQECLMAGMFGFPNFKAGKTQGKEALPRFGYWYRLIDAPDINRRNRS